MDSSMVTTEEEICPKCSKSLSDLQETPTGRKLRRCSAGIWNPDTRKTEGCDFVKWLPFEPQPLDEPCPKCQAPLVFAISRFGKKMKKCSTNSWDKEKKQAVGCDYIEWISGTTEKLDEKCPDCESELVLYTTAQGKKMKKCSTAGWDKDKKQAIGCAYIQWL